MIAALVAVAVALFVGQVALLAYLWRARSVPALPPPPPALPVPVLVPASLATLTDQAAADLDALRHTHPDLTAGQILGRLLRLQVLDEQGGGR